MSNAKKDADALKEEGNKLFGEKKYQEAHEKYTAAIELDGENIFYYTNRAAALLELKRYEDAITDSQKAISLDASFTRAWARLASAQHALLKYDDAITSYKKAIELLPSNNLSAAQTKQKATYESQLSRIKNVKAAKNASEAHVIPSDDYQRMPWMKAQAMMPQLLASGATNSSALVIYTAANNWGFGVRKMQQTRVINLPNGVQALVGPRVTEDLTNGLTIDERCASISDANFVQTLQRQLNMELKQHQGWVEKEVDVVIREACLRLREKGWANVRPALSVSIRSMLLQGLMASLSPDKSKSLVYYSRALNILEAGRKEWPGQEECGATFTETFVRGVRRLHLLAYMEACAQALQTGNKEKYPLSKLMDLATDALKEIERSTRPTIESSGFQLAFWEYCQANALAVKGFVYRKMAKFAFASGSVDEAEENLFDSTKCYIQAARILPEDEETRYWYLFCGISSAFRSGAPLRVTLPLVEELRLGIPKMKDLWELSSLALSDRDKAFQMLDWFEEDARKGLAEGSLTMESRALPDSEQNPETL